MIKRRSEIIKSKSFNRIDKVLIVLMLFSLVMVSTILLYNKDSITQFTGYVIGILGIPSEVTITANFSDEIGIVRQDFYGANRGKLF